MSAGSKHPACRRMSWAALRAPLDSNGVNVRGGGQVQLFAFAPNSAMYSPEMIHPHQLPAVIQDLKPEFGYKSTQTTDIRSELFGASE